MQLWWIQLLLPYLLTVTLSPGQTFLFRYVRSCISRLDLPPPVPWVDDVQPLPLLVESASMSSTDSSVVLPSASSVLSLSSRSEGLSTRYLLFPQLQALDHVHQYYSSRYPGVSSSLSKTWRSLWLSLLAFLCWIKALLWLFSVSV